MKSLYYYQKEHFNRLTDILEKYKIGIDVSCTGSGKTMVGIHIMNDFLNNKKIVEKIIVICPPTLIEHWNNYTTDFSDEKITIFSSHSLHKFKSKKFSDPFFVIVDECHLFKNSVKRTQHIKKIIGQSKYCLMMSATPYDDNRQFMNIKELFAIKKDIKEHISAMDFEYKTHTTIDYFHVNQDDEEIKQYEKGYKTIRSCTSNRGNNESVFRPTLFCSGLQKIHDSLIQGCIRFLENKLKEDNSTKYILVFHFLKHFEYIQNHLSDWKILTMNGSTPIPERKQIVENFQKNDLEYRIICISDEVGSVGIELDDKTGNYPRHMIILPMSNSINFCQALGRIQRTKTQSNSWVSIIQPDRDSTYFKTQIDRKFKVLEQFLKVPNIEKKYEKNIINK